MSSSAVRSDAVPRRCSSSPPVVMSCSMLFKKRALQLHQHQRHSGSIEVYCVCTCSGPASGARLMPSSLQLPSLSGLQLRRLLRTSCARCWRVSKGQIVRGLLGTRRRCPFGLQLPTLRHAFWRGAARRWTGGSAAVRGSESQCVRQRSRRSRRFRRSARRARARRARTRAGRENPSSLFRKGPAGGGVGAAQWGSAPPAHDGHGRVRDSA